MGLKMLKDWGYTASDTSSFFEDHKRRGTPIGFNRNRGNVERRRILMGVGALAVALFCTIIAFETLVISESKDAVRTVVIEKPAPIEMVDTLISAQTIQAGAPLIPDMFMRVKRPKIGLTPGALADFSQLSGQYARGVISAHQPIYADQLTDVPPLNPVISSIPEGFRAVTINVSATTSVEGWARAGAHVDVHWISDVTGQRVASIIVQNAKILSAERQVKANQEAGTPIPTTVTLLTSEADAQKISLASTAGTIVLHLRGGNDPGKSINSAGTLTLRDLVAGKSASTSNEDIEGVVRMRAPDGSLEEWAVIKGKLVRKI